MSNLLLERTRGLIKKSLEENNGVVDGEVFFIKELIDKGKNFIILKDISEVDHTKYRSQFIRLENREGKTEKGIIIASNFDSSEFDREDWDKFRGDSVEEFIEKIKEMYDVEGDLVLEARKEFGPTEWMGGLTPSYFVMIDERMM